MSAPTDSPFDGICPFCGRSAVLPIDRQVISAARRCQCGAIALGAPRRDFDEVLDDALNYFRVTATMEQKSLEPPERWLAVAGVELVDGGLEQRWIPLPNGQVVADHLQLYWFRRSAPAQP